MAQKRMFDKTITNNDSFLEMPDSTQNLYFHLSMEADDDGFVDNWKSIMRMTGKKEDDLKLLIAKSFIIPFETGVIVIKHWRINNYLRKDRYHPTKYLNEKAQLLIEKNEEYSLKNGVGIPFGNREENRIEENSIEENSIDNIYAQKFEKFWESYPKKTGKDKSKKWFEKYKPDEELFELMMNQLERFKDTEDWKKQGGKYIPYPTSWLNGKRWEDEFETDTEKEIRIEKEIIEGTYGIEGC